MKNLQSTQQVVGDREHVRLSQDSALLYAVEELLEVLAHVLEHQEEFGQGLCLVDLRRRIDGGTIGKLFGEESLLATRTFGLQGGDVGVRRAVALVGVLRDDNVEQSHKERDLLLG